MSRTEDVVHEGRTLTIGQLKRDLAELPDDAHVIAYEGEGGSWIVVRNGKGDQIAALAANEK